MEAHALKDLELPLAATAGANMLVIDVRHRCCHAPQKPVKMMALVMILAVL
jgi:hypothetical protein